MTNEIEKKNIRYWLNAIKRDYLEADKVICHVERAVQETKQQDALLAEAVELIKDNIVLLEGLKKIFCKNKKDITLFNEGINKRKQFLEKYKEATK